MAEKKIDFTGEVCPLPLLITQKEASTLQLGDKLILEIDSTQTVRNILKWCENNNYSFDVDEIGNGVWILTIIKS